MIITPLKMYLLVMLDSFEVGLFIFSFITFILCLLISMSKNEFAKYPFMAGCFLLLASMITPSTKQMAAIIVVPKIINNPRVQVIPEKILSLVEEYINELKKEGKNK
jgi:hypothetical protein